MVMYCFPAAMVLQLPHANARSKSHTEVITQYRNTPGALQVSFGDFAIFRMDEILEGRFNGGFARAATVRCFRLRACPQ